MNLKLLAGAGLLASTANATFSNKPAFAELASHATVSEADAYARADSWHAQSKTPGMSYPSYIDGRIMCFMAILKPFRIPERGYGRVNGSTAMLEIAAGRGWLVGVRDRILTCPRLTIYSFDFPACLVKGLLTYDNPVVTCMVPMQEAGRMLYDRLPYVNATSPKPRARRPVSLMALPDPRGHSGPSGPQATASSGARGGECDDRPPPYEYRAGSESPPPYEPGPPAYE